LLSFTERIQVNGKPVDEKDFARLVEVLKPEVEAVNREKRFGELTTFEILTALAFAYFKESGVDYQVLEAGLGGRLDATNVVKSEVCVLTSISYDHTDVLGDTLAKIAAEKAGIIKSGSDVVCSPQPPEALEVIERVCRERSARLIEVGRDVTWRGKGFSDEGQSFEVGGIAGSYELSIPLLGEYQLENAACAVAAVEVLSEKGASISSQSIADGLAQVRWPGRLQVLRRKPWLIIDGAHNAYSAKRLVEALKRYFNFDRAFLIFGASGDKDVPGLVAELAPLTDEVIVTGARNPRAVAPAVLVDEFQKQGVTPVVAENVAAAVEMALGRAKPADLICATGSIFVIAEVLEYVTEDYKGD
jgi:dihydrofolate synthase/folylpolyglutamate synthase